MVSLTAMRKIAFPWGKVATLMGGRMRGGTQFDFECRGGGMPRPPVYNSRVVKIDAATDGTEQRLPLEGKLAQRQLRLMRSKLKIITMGWYKSATFDLIRSGVAGPPSPPGEGFFRLAGFCV